jgi:hypothetical protein
MAKHDQRILKFLNQNADRAPTITEMMTRLNISISDISDSLGSLQAQGLISKKTNNQGIECWFPMGPQAAPQMTQPVQVQAHHLGQPNPSSSGVFLGDNRNPPDRHLLETRSFAGFTDQRPIQVPDPQPPQPKAVPVQPAPVQVQHIQAAEPSYMVGSRNTPPPQPEPSFNGNAPMYGLPQPAKGGIGFLTLALGLVASVAVSVWLSGRLAGNAVNRAARDFVDKKALTEATKSFNDFQDKTKAHVTALEEEVKKLKEALASSKAATDSLKTVAAAAKPEPAPAPAPAKSADKGKTAAAKAEPAAKAKPAKKTAAAKAKASSASANTSAIAKAAARGAAMRKKSQASKGSSGDGSDYSSSSSDYSSSASDPSPSVPEPPGLEELPPPPAD